jgi:hypothetical protein
LICFACLLPLLVFDKGVIGMSQVLLLLRMLDCHPM